MSSHSIVWYNKQNNPNTLNWNFIKLNLFSFCTVDSHSQWKFKITNDPSSILILQQNIYQSLFIECSNFIDILKTNLTKKSWKNSKWVASLMSRTYNYLILLFNFFSTFKFEYIFYISYEISKLSNLISVSMNQFWPQAKSFSDNRSKKWHCLTSPFINSTEHNTCAKSPM